MSSTVRDPCGTDSSLVGINAPCQRSTDCEKGLSCIAGMCAPPDSGKPDQDSGSSAEGGGPDGSVGD
jgi:hypothetical protein